MFSYKKSSENILEGKSCFAVRVFFILLLSYFLPVLLFTELPIYCFIVHSTGGSLFSRAYSCFLFLFF